MEGLTTPHMEYVRRSYRGGITQCFKELNHATNEVHYLDINSSYPSIFAFED